MYLIVPDFLLRLGYENYMTILGVIIPSWALFMILLERLYPYTSGIKLFRRGFWMDLIWYTLLQSKVLEIIIFSYIILGLKHYLGLENYGPLSHVNFWVLLFFFFITHDFYIYWFHRFQHNNKWFWRTHEAHHSVREVDWLAGSRSHFLEILINQTIEFAPIFFLLDSETAKYMYPAKALLDALWGMWIHANVNVNSGKLQYFFNGPEMHQWHHANHHEVFYKNYSTKLAIWDWIFGTAFLPHLKPLTFYFAKPKMFGLPYSYPKGFFGQTIQSLFRFDFKYWENFTFYYAMVNFRQIVFPRFLSWIGVPQRWTKENIFDLSNKKYELDEISKSCPRCQRIMKYYYQEDSLKFQCEYCVEDSSLEKFN